MTLARFVELVVPVFLGSLFGGGGLAALLWLVIRDRLKADFDKRYSLIKDLNGFGGRLRKNEEATGAALELARTTQNNVAGLEKTIAEELVKELSEIKADQRKFFEAYQRRDHEFDKALLMHSIALRRLLSAGGVPEGEIPPLPTSRDR